MTFHIDDLKQKTKKEILQVWEIALQHMAAQDQRIETLVELKGLVAESAQANRKRALLAEKRLELLGGDA